jgi:hypothetical protein
MFGFGNVLNLALHLGVPVWVAPLVAPAVDLSILGLLLGTRYLALAGASPDVLRPARRLLIFASVVTLALNVADPLIAGEYGRAAFDAVGPLLLIGWADLEQETHARTPTPESREGSASIPSNLLERARQEDAAHRAVHQRPISADTLRRRLRIGATRALGWAAKVTGCIKVPIEVRPIRGRRDRLLR